MIDLEWAHALAGILGAAAGAVGGIFVGGYRVGRIEGKLERAIAAGEDRMELKITSAAEAFGETLKGLRQKINDVELETERRFLLKDDFNEFRMEYRDDMKELKDMVRRS